MTTIPPPEHIADYNKIPQRAHEDPASDRADKIVHEAITVVPSRIAIFDLNP